MKILNLFLLIFALSLTQAVSMNDVTINNSNIEIYANYSNIEKLTITNTTIEIDKALGTSYFTNINGNATINIVNLVSPFDDILYNNNTLQNLVNYNIFFTEGEFFQIYSFSTPTTVIGGGGGGGTTIIDQSKIYNLSIDYSTWIKGEENSLYLYVYNIFEDYVDPEEIIVSTDLYETDYEYEIKRTQKGIYRIDFLINEKINNINIKLRVEDKTKSLKEEVNINLVEKTNEEKLNKATENLIIKTGNFFTDKIVQIALYSLLIIIITLSIAFFIFKRRKNKK